MSKRSYEYFQDNIFGNVADTYEECYYSGYDIGYEDCKKKLIDKACEIFRKIACEWYKPTQGRYTDKVVDNIIKTKFLPLLQK